MFEKFQILENKKGICQIKTYYNYEVNNKKYRNTEILRNYFFLNSYAAKDEINEFIKKSKIYFKKNKPYICSITKDFPLKNIIYSLISFLLFLYFIFLKGYLFRSQKNN